MKTVGEVECVWEAGAALGEGACWSVRRQCLWWVDILGRRLHRWDGERTTWELPSEVGAVAEYAEEDTAGDALLLSLRRGFARFDPATGALDVLHEPVEEPPGNRFNDAKCDARGRWWAGSMDFDCAAPTGALYRYTADGTCVRHPVGFAVTNGPTWSLDGRTMYFNDTVNGTVHAYGVDPATGTLGERRVWLRLAAGEGVPDGMTTDAEGRVWLAHWGAGCVTCHDPVSAAELLRVAVPARQVTSCAFGGPDLRTLYITTAATGLDARQRAAQPLAGGLFRVALDVAGLPANRFGPG